MQVKWVEMGSNWAGDYSIVFGEFGKEDSMNTLQINIQNDHKYVNKYPPNRNLNLKSL